MRTVTLSNGDIVTFFDKYTRKADRAYWRAQEKVVVEEQMADGTRRQETRAGSADESLQAAVLAMIVSVKRGEEGILPTEEWVEALPLEDYVKLSETLVELRKEAQPGRGKKNS